MSSVCSPAPVLQMAAYEENVVFAPCFSSLGRTLRLTRHSVCSSLAVIHPCLLCYKHCFVFPQCIELSADSCCTAGEGADGYSLPLTLMQSSATSPRGSTPSAQVTQSAKRRCYRSVPLRGRHHNQGSSCAATAEVIFLFYFLEPK